MPMENKRCEVRDWTGDRRRLQQTGRMRMAANSFYDPQQTMSDVEFLHLSEFIHTMCGIKMPLTKKIMLEARLRKRLRALRISSFREYCDVLFNSSGGADELIQMIDAVTTNKTDFFRDPAHFAFLTETVLPEFINDRNQRAGKNFAVWSAGCSTGEEPYTLAIVMSEFAARSPGFQFAIMATDISTKVLEKAQLGIYDRDQTATISPSLMQKYFLRSKDRDNRTVRIAPELRSLVHVRRMNLMDEELTLPEAVDAIFCRNVIIYFERKDQEKLLARLCRFLKPGGHLFLGHSETILGFELPLAHVMKTVYRKEK